MDAVILLNGIVYYNEIISNFATMSNPLFNFWIWISIIEFIIISYLLLNSRKKESKKHVLKRRSIEKKVDFENIINSSFHVRPLYDELKVKCHPDRFPNNKEKMEIALKLFQEISLYKTNYKKLIELKKEAEQKLSINF